MQFFTSVRLKPLLRTPARVNGGDLLLRFNTASNASYAVQSRVFDSETWQTVTNCVGSGDDFIFTDNASTGFGRMFRVVEQ